MGHSNPDIIRWVSFWQNPLWSFRALSGQKSPLPIYEVSGLCKSTLLLHKPWYSTSSQCRCVCECVGPLSLTVDKISKLQCVDAHVLVDALAYVIGSEEKEFCAPCIVALALIVKTTVSVLGSKEKASVLGMLYLSLSRLVRFIFLTVCSITCNIFWITVTCSLLSEQFT